MRERQAIGNKLKASCCEWFQGCTCHPEPEAIMHMHHALRQVMLPNYYPPADGETVESVMEKLHQRMSGQIHRAMFQKCLDKDATPESKAMAEAKADEVINCLPQVQQMVYEDVQETYNGDPAAESYNEIILTYPGLRALLVYRVAHVMVELDIPLLPRMMTEYAHQQTGIDIHPGASIGRGILIDHGTGIVIGETAIVGDHVRIYQGVTIGALYFPRDEAGAFMRKKKRHPTVEDGAVLYANATVLGGETVIGHHSVVGSNAWITESIPPYSKVTYRSDNTVRTPGSV